MNYGAIIFQIIFGLVMFCLGYQEGKKEKRSNV